jgi:hypothetical protein
MKTVSIGAGAGFSGDRIEPALELVEHGQIDYLGFECLAERTIALAQAARQNDPEAGYDPWLEERMNAVLAPAYRRGVRIVSNMGAANPAAAARAVTAVARRSGLTGLKTAAVTGDDVLDLIRGQELPLIDRPGTTADLGNRILSANAYLGAAPIAQALGQGANVVITGRVGDPALFLGPLMHEFGWAEDDWVRLGRGTLVGHLLECAGQLTGGYFADPGRKDVPDLARLGFPFAQVDEDGNAVLGKVAGSGGRISVATCTEQLLYEILDPSSYLQADVVADFSGVRFSQVGTDRVTVGGASGRARPDMLKVSIGYKDGFIGEGQISYAGPGAVERGRLALAVVEERLKIAGIETREWRGDLIGVDAVDRRDATGPEPLEVRVRIVARTETAIAARRIGAEVEALYTNGPAGGGGVSVNSREVIAVASTLLPREQCRPAITFETA